MNEPTHTVPRAKSAYAAYAEWMNWRSADGASMPQWSQMSTTERDAWMAASEQSLKHWLDHQLREAIRDRDYVIENGGAVMAVCAKRRDKAEKSIACAVLACVVPLIDPGLFDRYALAMGIPRPEDLDD